MNVGVGFPSEKVSNALSSFIILSHGIYTSKAQHDESNGYLSEMVNKKSYLGETYMWEPIKSKP